MLLHIVFFIAFTLYAFMVICVVIYLIYNYRKTKYPTLGKLNQGVDYFENVPVKRVSAIEYWLSRKSNKKVITMIHNATQVFVCTSAFQDISFMSMIQKCKNCKVFALGPDVRYVFKMMAYTYKPEFKYDFVEDEKNADFKCYFYESNQIDNIQNIVNYNDCHVERINFFLPFARYITNSKNQRFLLIDYLYYTETNLRDTFINLYSKTNEELNNFYQLYFQFYKMESFTDSLLINFDKPVAGLKILINKYDDLKVLSFPVQSNISIGDRLSFTNQISNSMNGIFYVQRIDKSLIFIQSYKEIINFYDHFTIIKKSDKYIKGKGKFPNGKVWFLDLDLPGTIKDNIAFIWNQDNQDGYHCIPDNTYKNKEECESRIDSDGVVKDFMIWDKPCKMDTECPFFKNSGRGNCKSGYCEMPVGVKRVGYRKYVKGNNSFPYCHQCPNFSSPDCCESKIDPDYAFSFDYLDRYSSASRS